MSERDIPFTEKNVSQRENGAADELIALGYQATPVVVIQDQGKDAQTLVGFSPSKLAEALL